MGLWSSLLAWLRAMPTKITFVSVTGLSPGSTAILSTSFPAGQTVTVKGRLVRVKGMAPIANAQVTVTVTPPSGTPWTATKTTDANGQFTVSVALAVVGNYVIRADYAGEQNKYKASSGSMTITALAAPLPTTLTLTGASQGTVGDTIVVTATLNS